MHTKIEPSRDSEAHESACPKGRAEQLTFYERFTNVIGMERKPTLEVVGNYSKREGVQSGGW